MDSVLRPHADVSDGQWVLDAVGEWDWTAGLRWLVPPIYEAYARILHPASGQQLRWSGDRVSGEEQRMRWREVAAREGTTLHPLAQWGLLIAGSTRPSFGEDGWQYGEPEQGRMDLDELAAVTEVLSRHTSTPGECFAAVWEGWGELHATRIRYSAAAWAPAPELETYGYVPLSAMPASMRDPEAEPRQHPAIEEAWYNDRFELPHRESLLFACDVRAFADTAWPARSGLDSTGNSLTPMALWPSDRAWYLASEVDFDSTIVGGSRALVDELLRLGDTDAAEVLEISIDADLTTEGDRLN